MSPARIAAGLLAGALFALHADPLRLTCATNRIGRFEVLEFQLTGTGEAPDPFDPARIDASVAISSAGLTSAIPAFFIQDYERQRVDGRDWFYPRGQAAWRARFAPPQPGDYRAVAVVRDAAGTRTSEAVSFTCVASTNRGFLRVSARDPRWLETSDGHPFFPIGQNLAFIGSQQYVTLSRAETIFRELAANGANYLRIWTGCEDWALAIEARKSAWGRSWGNRAPIVPAPGDPASRCVLLTNAVFEVQPSHEVGLRPGTKYRLSGRVRTEAGAALEVEVQGTGSGRVKSSPAESWADFSVEFTTGAGEHWLRGLRLRRHEAGGVWLADLSLREAGGGPELLGEADVNRPVRGFYNPLDCFWLDELVGAAQQAGLRLQLCLLNRDLYMAALKNATSPEYDQAIAAAKKTLRYAVARWGAFTSVAAWEYWNEMDPSLPTDRCYTELGRYLEALDENHHLRTTSTWGPSPKDCRHPELDFADVHFYLRPADKERLRDEVEAVLDRARWLRDQAPGKLAHQGEAGLADDQWRITDEMKRSRSLADFHNMLWASALSGSTGTALPWWWERLDERDHYPLFRPLSRFLADVPWTGGEVQPFAAEAAEGQLRVIGLRTRSQAWLWFFHRAAAWKYVVTAGQTPPTLRDVRFEVPELPAGDYAVEWWDTRTGETYARSQSKAGAGGVALAVPAFNLDIACRVRP